MNFHGNINFEETFLIPRSECLKKLKDIKMILDVLSPSSNGIQLACDKLQESIMWLELDLKHQQDGYNFYKSRL